MVSLRTFIIIYSLIFASLALGASATDDKAADPAIAAKKSNSEQVSEKKFWIHQGKGLQAFVTVDINKPAGPVNKLIFGACSYWPPVVEKGGKQETVFFEQSAIDAVKPFLSTGSLRLWAQRDPQDEMNVYGDFVSKVKPARIYAFYNYGHRPAKNAAKLGTEAYKEGDIVSYTSEKNNNLYAFQTPKSWAEEINKYNLMPRPGVPNGFNVDYWELWNEPTFACNGGWDPCEHAKWCLDTAKYLKQQRPSVKIGPHIYNPAEWNEKFLTYLAEHDKDNLIDYIVSHYYDTKWFQQWDTYGSYIGRVAYSSEIQQLVRRDIEMVKRISKGHWNLACTEWNNHPQRYDWPGEATHDLAVALFQASTLQAFTEEGMEAAMVFSLRSPQFGLIGDEAAKNKWPTFYVFEMYGKYFNGVRLPAAVVAPKFVWNWKTSDGVTGDAREVSYVDIMASKDDVGRIVLMVVNKHPEDAIDLNILLPGFSGLVNDITMITLSGDDKDAIEGKLEQSKPVVSNPLIVKLPAHSFSAILLKGDKK